MDKYLITGFSGFVARHFLNFLEDQRLTSHVLGVDVHFPDWDISKFKYVHCEFELADLLDKSQVDNIIYQFQPAYILHLASYSSVAFSWKNPISSFANNTNIFLNLLEEVRVMNLDCRVLSVGSSEEYGNFNIADLPLQEEHMLNPLSPYAVARVSQEMLSRVYVDGYGMDLIMTRSFNHIGPGQRDIFVISSFVKQLVEMKHYNRTKEISTGDLSIVRDFLDVRDVVKAYYLLFKKGRKGAIYNVCSNIGISLQEALNKIMQLLEIDVDTKINPTLIRPNDNRIIIGSNKKLRVETNWYPVYTLEDSLRDIIKYWSDRV